MRFPNGSRAFAAALAVLASHGWLTAPIQAYPFGEKHRQTMVYLPVSPYGAAPAAAPTPVMIGAISTASAPIYVTQGATTFGSAPIYAPTTASAPAYVTTATASAPTYIVATGTASAPASTVVPTVLGSAPALPSSTLPYEEVQEVLNSLITTNTQLKSDTPDVLERKEKLLEAAKKAIADKRVVAVESLEQADNDLAEQLAMIAVKSKNSYSLIGSSPSAGTVILPTAAAAPATTYQIVGAAPAAPSMYLYPVTIVPAQPRHHFWNKIHP
jgi:hypothetical protein